MEFLNKLKSIKPVVALKIVGFIILAVVVLVFAIGLVGRSVSNLSGALSNKVGSSKQLASPDMMDGVNMAMDKASNMWNSSGAVELSMRNASSAVMPRPDYAVPGDDAEDYEVTEYSANIETGNLEKTCGSLDVLKSRTDVIFESATKNNNNCYYRFKVVNDSVEEILAVIEGMDPEDLSKNSYTIKRTVNDFTNEIEVLEKKLESIEDTLDSAINAYDEITELATDTKDVESLAKIINSKIRIIERLTQEKIMINEQLDRLDNAKFNQLDRLDYTYFNVDIYENKYLDWDNLSDSWQTAIKNFVYDINKSVQNITIDLIVVIFMLLQYVIYALLILLILKYGWQLAKYIWQK